MKIKGAVALVTGANRGLGKAYAQALLAAGAARVYAGARDPSGIASGDPRLVPLRLDVTSADDVAAAVAACADVNLLINNAGVMLMTPMLRDTSEAAMRAEFEVNVFGMQRMIRAFAPVLAGHGGGGIINMLSVVSWFTAPFNSTYGASKHAALVVSDAARIELAGQGTRVVGVYAGFIDTDMAAEVNMPKTSPRQVAEASLNGLENGLDHVQADDRAREIWQATRTDPAALAANMAKMWAAGGKPYSD